MKPRLKSSPAARDLIKAHEPFRAEAIQRGRRWVVGYGHTASARDGVKLTEADAELLLVYDVMQAEQAIDAAVGEQTTGGMRDALVSFACSIGPAAFRVSDVARLAREGRHRQAAAAIETWVRAEEGGRLVVSERLVRRRAAERSLYLKGLAALESAQARTPPPVPEIQPGPTETAPAAPAVDNRKPEPAPLAPPGPAAPTAPPAAEPSEPEPEVERSDAPANDIEDGATEAASEAPADAAEAELVELDLIFETPAPVAEPETETDEPAAEAVPSPPAPIAPAAPVVEIDLDAPAEPEPDERAEAEAEAPADVRDAAEPAETPEVAAAPDVEAHAPEDIDTKPEPEPEPVRIDEPVSPPEPAAEVEPAAEPQPEERETEAGPHAEPVTQTDQASEEAAAPAPDEVSADETSTPDEAAAPSVDPEAQDEAVRRVMAQMAAAMGASASSSGAARPDAPEAPSPEPGPVPQSGGVTLGYTFLKSARVSVKPGSTTPVFIGASPAAQPEPEPTAHEGVSGEVEGPVIDEAEDRAHPPILPVSRVSDANPPPHPMEGPAEGEGVSGEVGGVGRPADFEVDEDVLENDPLDPYLVAGAEAENGFAAEEERPLDEAGAGDWVFGAYLVVGVALAGVGGWDLFNNLAVYREEGFAYFGPLAFAAGVVLSVASLWFIIGRMLSRPRREETAEPVEDARDGADA